MSLDAYRAVRETIQAVFQVLAAVGVPGAGLAEKAVQKVAAYLDEQRAWDALQGALARAEQAFREDARRRGWHHLAAIFCSRAKRSDKKACYNGKARCASFFPIAGM